MKYLALFFTFFSFFLTYFLCFFFPKKKKNGQALKGVFRERVQLASKFGIKYSEDGQSFEIKGDPAYVRAACEASLKRLDVDYIDLYYQHRIDTRVPIEVTV